MFSTCSRKCWTTGGSSSFGGGIMMINIISRRTFASKGNRPYKAPIQRKPVAITSTDLIKQLRFETGAPILECRKALNATNNDLKEAQDWLREHGVAKVTATNRHATDGLVGLRISADAKSASFIKVASETDFTAKSTRFVSLVSQVAQAVLSARAASDDDNAASEELVLEQEMLLQCKYDDEKAVKELVEDAVVAIRENISVPTAIRWQITDATRDSFLIGYAHNRVDSCLDDDDNDDALLQAGTVAAIVELQRIDPELPEVNVQAIGKKLAMHIVATSPMYLHPNEVPMADIERERDLITTQVMKKRLNDETVRKTVAGILRKYFENVCLSEQPHSIEESIKHIGVGMKELGVEIIRFKRLEVS